MRFTSKGGPGGQRKTSRCPRPLVWVSTRARYIRGRSRAFKEIDHAMLNGAGRDRITILSCLVPLVIPEALRVADPTRLPWLSVNRRHNEHLPS